MAACCFRDGLCDAAVVAPLQVSRTLQPGETTTLSAYNKHSPYHRAATSAAYSKINWFAFCNLWCLPSSERSWSVNTAGQSLRYACGLNGGLSTLPLDAASGTCIPRYRYFCSNDILRYRGGCPRRAHSHAPTSTYWQRKSPAVPASEKLAWLNAIVGYCHVARVRAQGDGRNSEVGRKDGEQQFIFAEHCAARRAAQARLRVAGAR